MVNISIDRELSSSSNRSGSISSNYRVQIIGRTKGEEISVVAQVPDTIGLQIENGWDSWWGSGEVSTGNSTVNNIISTGRALTGVTNIIQGLTVQTWTGTSPLEFQLPLLLNAREDAYHDVVEPMTNIVRLASPYKITLESPSFSSSASEAVGIIPETLRSILHAPGPTFADLRKNDNNSTISLNIGRFIAIPSVVINSVEVSIPTRYTREGYPIELDINVSLRTQHTYAREDILGAILSR